MKLMMLNLTEVMPGGCPGSETLKSRDCVTGDSYFASFYHTGDQIIKMVERNMTMTLHNWGDFHNANDFDESNVTSSFVLLRLIAEWGTKAPGVLKG